MPAVNDDAAPTSSGADENSDGLEIPKEFHSPRYSIGIQFSRGGMGGIWKAIEATTGRVVAIKRMLRATNASEFRRFLAEARFTARLEHPNIVPVHEVGLGEDGQVFYSMKLVRGVDLAAVLRKIAEGDTETVERFPLSELLTIFQKVCDAVGFAHSKGVIHRDLKPGNVMTGEFGEVLVMDWGLAKTIGGAESSEPDDAAARRSMRTDLSSGSETLPGSLIGTLYYMAPEQAVGDIAAHGPHTDIYALGAILYNTLSLRQPVSGKTVPEVISRIADGNLDPLITNGRPQPALPHLPGGTIPASLAAVVAHAMAKDPNCRYASVAELQREITAYQTGYATAAERAGLLKLVSLAVRRHRGEASVAAIAVAVLLAATAWGFQRIRGERDIAQEQRGLAETQRLAVEKANAVIVQKNAANLKNLHEASMADYNVAVQRIEKDGKWSEGVAHLSRALRWEPANPLAAGRLYATLSLYAPEKHTAPRNVLRHQDEVRCAQFSPDGTRIVTASEDKTARVWDAATGQPLGAPLLHQDKVRAAQFSPDGTRIVTASDDKTARIWDAATGQPLAAPLQHQDEVWMAQYSPDATRIITASGSLGKPGGIAQMWDAATGKLVGEALHHESCVFSAQFSPDGTRIVTASGEEFFKGEARVWKAATGKPIGKPLRHEERVWSAQFSADGTRIVTASFDRTAQVWDAATGKPLGEPLRHEHFVISAQFSPDGTRVVTASEDQTAQVWDTATGEPLGEPLRHEAGVWSAQFSPDGTRVVTASYDHTTRVWDAGTGHPLGEPRRHGDRVWSAQFSADGTRIVTASSDQTATIWDQATGQPLGEPLRHKAAVVTAQFSADGTHIVTTSDNAAWIWNAVTKNQLNPPLRHEGWVFSAEFSADGTRIATASEDKTARVWDATTGQPLGAPLRHQDEVTAAQFSPDGTRIVTASADKTARVWDAATGQPLGAPLLHLDKVTVAQFSPDGTRIITGSDDKTAQVWDAATGQALGTPLRHQDKVRAAQFSRDGTRIVTGSYDHTARVWAAATGDPLGETLRHEGSVLRAEFSPDGTRIVTASDDLTARVWDAATGKLLGHPLLHNGVVSSAHFSPNGAYIVTASGDDIARVWDAAIGKPLGELFHHEGSLHRAQFSPDGTCIITTSEDNTARVWNVSMIQHLPTPVPDWMLLRASAIVGFEFDANEELRSLPPERRRAVLLEPTTGNDEWTKLARWLAQPVNERTLTPDSKFTCRQIAERERDSGFKEGIESALRYDPTVPLAHVLLAKWEDNPQRADFLRGYGLKLLPDDASLWARAAASLVEQKDFARAVKAADKTLSLDPQNDDAQKARAGAQAGME